MKKYFLLLALASLLFSCDDDFIDTSHAANADIHNNSDDPTDPEDDTDDTDDNNATLNLCVGDGSTTPLPLAVGNRWYLIRKLGGWSKEVIVSQKVVKNGKEYFQVDYDEDDGLNGYQKFLRVDSNGDIYELEQFMNGDREYMLVPGNPTDGQQWDYHGFFDSETFIRKIRLVSVSESSFLAFDTNECTITDYLIVDKVKIHDNGLQTVISNTLYAPGVGYIGGIYNKLSELELQ